MVPEGYSKDASKFRQVGLKASYSYDHASSTRGALQPNGHALDKSVLPKTKTTGHQAARQVTRMDDAELNRQIQLLLLEQNRRKDVHRGPPPRMELLLGGADIRRRHSNYHAHVASPQKTRAWSREMKVDALKMEAGLAQGRSTDETQAAKLAALD